MADNFLQLNADETEVLIVASVSKTVQGIRFFSSAVQSNLGNICIINYLIRVSNLNNILP